jgi:hypothetical protein
VVVEVAGAEVAAVDAGAPDVPLAPRAPPTGVTALEGPDAVAPTPVATLRLALLGATPAPLVADAGAEATAPPGPPLGPTPGLAGTVPFELAGGETAAV